MKRFFPQETPLHYTVDLTSCPMELIIRRGKQPDLLNITWLLSRGTYQSTLRDPWAFSICDSHEPEPLRKRTTTVLSAHPHTLCTLLFMYLQNTLLEVRLLATGHIHVTFWYLPTNCSCVHNHVKLPLTYKISSWPSWGDRPWLKIQCYLVVKNNPHQIRLPGLE